MPQQQGNTNEKTITIPLGEYEQLKYEQAKLRQQVAELQRLIFGTKSERYVGDKNADQLSLDMEGVGPASNEEQPEKETLTYQRKKQAGKKNKAVRAPIPDHLPRKIETIEPEQVPEGSKKIGEETTEVLEYKPCKFYVRKFIRPKYAVPNSEGVVIGTLPSLPIPRGNAGPGLLAHLVISKFTDHLPFYRQRQQFKRQGLDIAESTINDWFTNTCRLLTPLYNKLRTLALATDYLQADETPIPVQTSKKPGATHKGYHWVYHAPPEKLVLFDYRKSRGRDGPEAMLNDFSGALQTDGYAAYNGFDNNENITLLACMAHARRKFDKAKDNDRQRSEYVLGKMQALYAIERKAREESMSATGRKALRQEKAVPVLNELEQWLKTNLHEVLPRYSISEAIQYTLKLWPRLRRYTEDGRWEIDNNLIENTIRPVALGRKNYLFAGSHKAAQRAAMVYSFLGTCKLNDIEPLAWLKNVLTRLPDHPVNKLDELLPHNWQPDGKD